MDSWVLHANAPQDSLAFSLADAGFDVWLANGPGSNDYSRHEFLVAREQPYWEYDIMSSVTDFTQTLMYIKRETKTTEPVIIFSYGTSAFNVLYRYAENSTLLF